MSMRNQSLSLPIVVTITTVVVAKISIIASVIVSITAALFWISRIIV